MRSGEKKRVLNQNVLSELHTLDRKLTVLAKEKPAEAKDAARHLASRYDKAVSQGIIPHGRADRKKARIAKLVNQKS